MKHDIDVQANPFGDVWLHVARYTHTLRLEEAAALHRLLGEAISVAQRNDTAMRAAYAAARKGQNND